MKYTVDNESRASQPGNIEILKTKYLDYMRIKGIQRFIYGLLFTLPESVLFKMFGWNSVVYNYINKQEQFRYGCLNPAIVLNKEKGLIAVFTNLTSFGEEITPVIKISEEPLYLIKNVTIETGQKLPTVSLYLRNPDNLYATVWMDFVPKIANCFTDDTVACNKLLSRVPENGWICLEMGLKQINTPEQTGLYHIQLEKELVKNS